jgi:hypothetical protein
VDILLIPQLVLRRPTVVPIPKFDDPYTSQAKPSPLRIRPTSPRPVASGNNLVDTDLRLETIGWSVADSRIIWTQRHKNGSLKSKWLSKTTPKQTKTQDRILMFFVTTPEPIDLNSEHTTSPGFGLASWPVSVWSWRATVF